MKRLGYLFSILTIVFSFCSVDEDDSTIIPPAKKKDKWVKVLYYKDLSIAMDSSVTYLGLLTEDEAKNKDHIRVYYDKNGRSIKQESYDEYGKRNSYVNFFYKDKYKVRAEGFNYDGERIFARFYNKGKLAKEQFYNELGEPDRYHIFLYDKKGNIIEEKQASLFDNEKVKKKYIYDNKNRLIKESYYIIKNNQDSLIYYMKREYTKKGILKFMFVYNNNNFLSSKTYFDDNENKVKVEQYKLNSVLFKYVDEYKNGQKWKTTFYKENGKPDFYEIYNYDKEGRIKVYTYSIKGKLIKKE